MASCGKSSIALLLMSAVHFSVTTGCEWSNWETISECDVDPLLCFGNRTDTRSCTDMDDQSRTIPCEGKCKPCSAWSNWSQPCRQVRSRQGTQRRYRHCSFFFGKRQREFQYRPSVCAGCPWCGHGAGYDCTLC